MRRGRALVHLVKGGRVVLDRCDAVGHRLLLVCDVHDLVPPHRLAFTGGHVRVGQVFLVRPLRRASIPGGLP